MEKSMFYYIVHNLSWFYCTEYFLGLQYYFTASLAKQFREESDIRMWNIWASYFRQEAGESIMDYGLRFDTKIVETYPLLEPMSNQ